MSYYTLVNTSKWCRSRLIIQFHFCRDPCHWQAVSIIKYFTVSYLLFLHNDYEYQAYKVKKSVFIFLSLAELSLLGGEAELYVK